MWDLMYARELLCTELYSQPSGVLMKFESAGTLSMWN